MVTVQGIQCSNYLADDIKACTTHVKIAPTGNIHIDVNGAYSVSEYVIIAKDVSENNGHVAVYIWHCDWSFTFNRRVRNEPEQYELEPVPQCRHKQALVVSKANANTEVQCILCGETVRYIPPPPKAPPSRLVKEDLS